MTTSKSIQAYNNIDRAKKYNAVKGFDPPRKARMLEIVVRSLVELVPPNSYLLELGAGSGDLTYQLLETNHFNIYATDGAEAMLEFARRDERSSFVSLERLDFTEDGWGKRFTNRFDAVTSSMALHHAMDKILVFKQVYELLKVRGVFIFSDHISGNDNYVDKLIDRERARVKLVETLDEDKILEFIQRDKESQENEGNVCESVPTYLDYLARAGFEGIDCIWRDYWIAVFVAFKS